MYLSNIQLHNFKNYDELYLDFTTGINCILGKNGFGKTNLLDSIYYLCMTRSHFNSIDQQNIKHSYPYFVIRGEFQKNEKAFPVSCHFQTGKKKSLSVNKKEYDKISDHIGLFPCVLIAPNDTDLIREGSEMRRKFFDNMISQIDRNYLHDLQQYNQVLKHRNALLKQLAETQEIDKDLIESYDTNLVKLSEKISKTRLHFLSLFNPFFQKNYNYLTENQEKVALSYSSKVQSKEFEEDFKKAFQKDLILQRTTMGIHKDDYLFSLDEHSIKKFGSQGQQKTFIISLQLAKFQTILEQTSIKPILLMDDIFDKLDDHRIQRILSLLEEDIFGQIFISDARPERSEQLLSKNTSALKIYNLEEILD